MNVSKQIISVLDALCEKFGIAIDWSQQNVLPYVRELMGKYIRYEIATSVTWCVIFLVAIIVMYKITMKLHKKASSEEIDWYFDEPVAVFTALSWGAFGVILVAGVVVSICQLFDIATCIIFPEKQIVDYIMTLSNR